MLSVARLGVGSEVVFFVLAGALLIVALGLVSFLFDWIDSRMSLGLSWQGRAGIFSGKVFGLLSPLITRNLTLF